MTSKTEPRHFVELPPELIQALGEVSARYGQIEHLLTMTIHRTAPISYDDAVAKVEELRHREKIRKEAKRSFNERAIQEFGEIEGNKRAETFNDLIQNWAALADRRDDVIHCCWSVGIEDKQLSGTRRGELLKWDGRLVGVEDVQKLADNLKQFVVRLNTATMPSQLPGPENEIAAMPGRFSVNYTMPPGVETTATAAAIFKKSDDFTKRSAD